MRNWWIVGAAVGAFVVLSRTVFGQTTATLSFDAEVGDDSVMTGPVVTTGGIQALAIAIAHAEGYYVPGSAPNRANNPGDLKIPGWTGTTTGAEGVSVFNTPAEGWQRLYKQLDLVRTGASHVYTPGMSLGEFAAKYTDTQASAWLSNVLSWLNTHSYDADENTSLAEVLA